MIDEPARHRTIVKVCGLTRLQDAHDARRAGADWLGFIVHGESPRLVRPEYMSTVMTTLPGAIGVAVMVGPTPDEALDLARRAYARRIQLHRVEAASWPSDFPLPVSFAIGIDARGELRSPLPPEGQTVLLDTAHASLAGGTGERFPWGSARELCARRAVMIAGGLDATCVVEALEACRPFGVDASSRLESAPGHKDKERVIAYVSAVREWDARQPAGA